MMVTVDSGGMFLIFVRGRAVKRCVLVLVLCNAGRPLVAAANVDGQLQVFCALYQPGEHFRLTLRFLVQPSENAESCDGSS